MAHVVGCCVLASEASAGLIGEHAKTELYAKDWACLTSETLQAVDLQMLCVASLANYRQQMEC